MDKSSIRRTYKDFDDYDNRGYDTYDDDDEYRRWNSQGGLRYDFRI